MLSVEQLTPEGLPFPGGQHFYWISEIFTVSSHMENVLILACSWSAPQIFVQD